MINVIVNRTITKHTTPAMIGIITGLSSPRIEGGLESTTVTVELNVGSEEDVDKDTNDRTLEVVTVELNVGSEEDVDKDTNECYECYIIICNIISGMSVI